jgi:O-antigen/teichoic acid export membrane protein
MIMGRVLSQSEYALLASFFAILAIVQRPVATMANGFSHYSSLLVTDKRIGDVKGLLQKWVFIVGIPAVLLCLGALLFEQEIVRYFHLSRSTPIFVASAIIPVIAILPIFNGVGQGLQLFGWVALSSIGGALTRLLFGAVLVLLIFPASSWAILGHGIGVYVSLIIIIVGIFIRTRKEQSSNSKLPSLRLYLLQNFVSQAAYVILMTADVVIAAHYVPMDKEFAYAATLGRIVVFLPSAIVAAMFPKVSSRGTLNKDQKSVFLNSFGLTTISVICSVFGCFVFSDPLARLLFGITEISDHLNQMIIMMALVMGVSALLNIMMSFLIAQQRFKETYIVVVFALFYLTGSTLYHENSMQIVIIAGLCNAAALIFVSTKLYVAVLRKKSSE